MSTAITILVTGGGTATALSVVKGLRMQSDVLVRVLLGDPSPLIAGRYLADGYVQLISASSSEYCEDLLAKCVASDVDLVIPVFDGEFAALAAARPQFESAGVRVAIASPEAIAQCRDKHKTGELFARLGLGRPTTYSESEARSLSADAYPLFLKPADGRGSLGIARVDFPADLDRHLTTMEAPVIQECIEGADISEITIDCLSDLDGNFVACLPRERQVIKAGQSYKGLSFRDAEIESACRLLCEALHLAGPSCIQCFRTPEGPLFIEINPRFGAASVLAMAAGLNGPAYLACQVANKTPAVPAPRSGIQMLRYWQEVFVDLEQDVALDAVKLR